MSPSKKALGLRSGAILAGALAIIGVVSASATVSPGATAWASEPTVVEARADADVMRRAALRIVVTTTSDWAQVDLPGISAGHVVVDNPQGRQVRPTARGLVVRGPVRTYGTVTVDLVTEVPQSFEAGEVTVSQGGAGGTSVQVDNRTEAPYRVASLSTSWSPTRRSVKIPADTLMGTQQLEWDRADGERRVLAFTYPWFGEWAKTDPRLSVHPAETWRTLDRDDAVHMASVARAHGIDGFVMSFAGAKHHGLPLHHSLEAAAETGGTATILLETTQAGSAAIAEQWLAEALRQGDHPAFMRLDGVPVVFTFASGSVSPAEWQGITQRLAVAGTPVRIIADAWHGNDGAFAGHYRYNALLQSATDEMTSTELLTWNQAVSRGLRARSTLGAGSPGVVVATVQPGWDNHLMKGEGSLVIPRDGTATYDRTWQAAVASEADWVVITSWTEWYEGTGIARSTEHGTTALEATATWAERFHG